MENITKIDLITGFLGAGKTTFIKKYTAYLHSKGISFAIVENDFGKAGIDSAILKNFGESVNELSGGCICCGLKVQFHNLLITLSQSGVERIIVEPSGVFDPDDFFDIVRSPSVSSCLELGAVVDILDTPSLLSEDEHIKSMLFKQLRSANIVIRKKEYQDNELNFELLLSNFYDDWNYMPENQRVILLPWQQMDSSFFDILINEKATAPKRLGATFDHSATFNSTVLPLKRSFSIEQAKKAVELIFSGQCGNILRIKGHIALSSGEIALLNCTKDSFSLDIDYSWEDTLVNIIGINMNRKQIRKIFDEC